MNTNTDATGGVSKRSLVLLGALAGLMTNRDTRRALVDGTRTAWSGTQHTLSDSVKPALLSAAAQAAQIAQETARSGAHTVASTASSLKDEAAPRASALLDSVLHAASGLAGQAQEVAARAATAGGEGARTLGHEAGRLASDAGVTVQTQAQRGLKRAEKATRPARRAAALTLSDASGAATELLANVQDTVSSTLHEAVDGAEARRRRVERTLRQARRDAERELRSGKKQLSSGQLERAVSRKLAPLEKQLGRELKVIEQQVRRARKDDRGSGGGTAATLVLLGTGAVVLARVPAARQAILSAVEKVSPEAAQGLHQAGRNARNLIGTMWLERIEEPQATPAPGAAKATQAATTGASAAGAVAPDAPAAAKTAAQDGAAKPDGQAKQTN
ncbi:alginate biosynthesis protein AlgP [Deinococcus xianganensis]|uniref:Alginate biosynthesis protein AlgP n=1 Tax=Deinococcus xianganensis TaxID=1507289 RepID=A0A6I4YF82_9DEIO|nr:alginate biosynthesis protein AlgP [Deinococcus xianganensis]MXV19060.1 alginate biosynthesis protein AlgP [Deinococcus xianganensis]